jgi:hypothetical protein
LTCTKDNDLYFLRCQSGGLWAVRWNPPGFFEMMWRVISFSKRRARYFQTFTDRHFSMETTICDLEFGCRLKINVIINIINRQSTNFFTFLTNLLTWTLLWPDGDSGRIARLNLKLSQLTFTFFSCRPKNEKQQKCQQKWLRES